MSDALKTIEFLSAKVRDKEVEVVALKRLINGLCDDAKIPHRYLNIVDASDSADGTLRRDQFYGQTLSSAARSYLEMRRARGAASVNEIYKAIREGGYKFDTKDEDNAKAALRTILRKNSAIFHRLPSSGDYGLLAWYPNAKAAKTDDEEESDEGDDQDEKPKATPAPKAAASNSQLFVADADIRAVILKLADVGKFTSSDVERKIAEDHPGRTARDGAASIMIYRLRKKGLLNIVAERVGRTPAVYIKA